MRLNRLVIHGFKDPDRIVDITFSKEPISVIYGPNGSGKTTLLKVIHAILNRDETALIKENIQKIEIYFEVNEIEKYSEIDITILKMRQYEAMIDFVGKSKDENGIKKSHEVFKTNKILDNLFNSNSILFGVHRGVILNFWDFIQEDLIDTYLHEIYVHAGNSLNDNHSLGIAIYNLETELRSIIGSNKPLINKINHINTDFIEIKEIKKAISTQYQKGQNAISEKVKNAFFNTINNAVKIEIEGENYELPSNFWSRLDKQREFLIDIIAKLEDSFLQNTLLVLLKKISKRDIPKSQIFKALLVNILEKAEEDNPDLKSINKLIEVFNDHLYKDKKLVVTNDDAYIALPKDRKHELSELSSGERHLLTFLTLFLIMARGRDFYLIDEPEISLSMEWQRELLPLLSELSPSSQIIVATHSPSIANRNYEYLVELK